MVQLDGEGALATATLDHVQGAAPGGDQKENENPIADNLCGSKPYPDAVKNGHTKDFAAGGSQAG